MKIGIIGCGVVGEATARSLERRGYLPIRHDPAKGWRSEGGYDIAFICVPTPGTETGHLDTVTLQQAFSDTQADMKVVRSTVPLGFMDFLGSGVYMPSFLREAFPETEWQASVRVYGGKELDCVAVESLFDEPELDSIRTDYRTAEFIKLAFNANLAMQVSFATEMAQAAETFRADWEGVRRALDGDGRFGTYTRPGPFGGACLPKDTANLATQTDSTLLRAVLEVNNGNHHTRQLQEVSQNAARR